MQLSENREPIAPDGSVPFWRERERVRIPSTWEPGDATQALPEVAWLPQAGQVCTILTRGYDHFSGWRYLVRFDNGSTSVVLEHELRCYRHNSRGGTEITRRHVRTYCTCGQQARTEPNIDQETSTP